jgi:hypothetical protein
MKKAVFKLTVALLCAWTGLLPAQNSPADALFEKYSGKEGYTSVYITKAMFDLFSTIETSEDEKDFVKLASSLDCIKILSADKEDGKVVNKHINFYDEIMANLPANKYEELMTIKEKDSDVKFYIFKQGLKIREFLMVVGGKESNALISIQGDIDLKTISRLSKTMKIEGMENLDKLEEEQKK